MDLMSPKDITLYLKNVMDVESLLFRQRMMKEEAQKGLHYTEPICRTIAKPQKKQLCQPTEPKVPVSTGTMVGYIIFAIIAAGVSFFGLWALGEGIVLEGLGLLFFALPSLYACVVAFKRGCLERNEYPQKKQGYDTAMHQYRSSLAEEEAAYREKSVQWQQELAKAEQEHQLAKMAAQARYKGAVEQVNLLDKPIADAEAVLEDLYGLDIIFPKYRNLPAVCTFYEYFSSGRCSELSGSNGAYNMYESELRQNLIINKLDTIMGSLEGIRENQYILYTEIKKAASVLPMISRDVAQMLDETKGIASSAAIASQCSEAAAKNTEVLKYLALVKR